MPRKRAHMKPSEIRFTHGNISSHFKNGKNVLETLADLRSGEMSVEDIPKITVVKRHDLFFSVNNRRLWMFQQLERIKKELGEELLVPVKFGFEIVHEKFSTRNEGQSVYFRGKSVSYKATMKVSSIRYSNDTVNICGMDTIMQLENESLTIADLPKLTVVYMGGAFFALDNELLWIYKEYATSDLEMSVNVGMYRDLPTKVFERSFSGNDGEVKLLFSQTPKHIKLKGKCSQTPKHIKLKGKCSQTPKHIKLKGKCPRKMNMKMEAEFLDDWSY